MKTKSESAGNRAKLPRLEMILERAATELGDINPLVLKHYYAKYPEAKERFVHHGINNVERLENEMVESALYCLMIFFERPSEIEILLGEMVPHHEFLEIPLSFFTGLMESVFEVIERTVPPEEEQSREILRDLKRQLVSAIEQASANDPVKVLQSASNKK